MSIVSTVVIDKRETELKSVNMEKLALQRSLALVDSLQVTELVTDAHVQISALMSEFTAVVLPNTRSYQGRDGGQFRFCNSNYDKGNSDSDYNDGNFNSNSVQTGLSLFNSNSVNRIIKKIQFRSGIDHSSVPRRIVLTVILRYGIKLHNMYQYVNGCMGSLLGLDYPHIVHQWDIWHAAKNLRKKLLEVCSTY